MAVHWVVQLVPLMVETMAVTKVEWLEQTSVVYWADLSADL